MAPLPKRVVNVCGTELSVVMFNDLRPTATNSQRQEWLFQTELEALLFDGDVIGRTGAFYRLLNRSGVGHLALSLRRTSVGQGLLSDSEFDELRGLLHTGVRVFTLVPAAALRTAVATFGRTPESEGLLNALGIQYPEEWTDSVMEDEEEEDQSGSNDDESDSGDGGDGRSSARGESSSSDSNHDGSDSGQDDDCPSTDEEYEPVVVGNESNTHQPPRITVSPTLEAQLQAFTRFRTQAVNRQRKGKAVAAITASDDRQHVLRFFAWLKHTKGTQSPTMNLFTSASMGGAVETYIEERKLSRKDATVAKAIASLVAASRFTHAMLRVKAAPGTVVSTAPVDELIALHTQVLSEARMASKFSAALPPKSWLDWGECQRARLAAERAVAEYDGNDVTKRLSLARAACLLKILTALPPDRVGVYRLLKMGDTLKTVGETYQVDLTERGAHKTSAVFGPSRTTVTDAVATRITALVSADKLKAGEFLFHAADRGSPQSPSAWTRLVQQTFKTYSGVALSPKDCRASFITWLRDGAHGDETLRSAALAMKHSSTTAASASYDKHGSDRLVGAAVAVADAFAKRYT